MKSPVASACLFAVLLVALLICGCPRSFESGTSTSEPIDIASVECTLGTGGLWDASRWSRLVISAHTRKGIFRGEVEVQGQDFDGRRSPESFRKRFEVSTERQAIEIPVLPRNWIGAEVTFRGDGAAPQTWDLKLEGPRHAKFRILFIGEKSSTPGELTRATEKWLGLESEDAALGIIQPRDLPRHFLGYAAADLVVLHRTAIAEMDDERWNALLEWTRRGGTVATVRGAERTALVPERAREILEEPPRPPAGGQEASEGSMTVKRVGAGWTLIVPSSEGRDSLEIGPDGSFEPPALAKAIRKAVEAGEWGARLRISPSTGLAGVESAALRALVWFSGFRYPSRTKVLVFYLGYLGIGFFLAGAFFRGQKRLERMYLFALGLAILAGIGIYRFGLLSAIHETCADEVTVAMVRPDSTLADAVSWVGIGSPSRRTLRIDSSGFSGTAVPSQPLAENGRGSARRRAGELLPLPYELSGLKMGLPELLVYANSTRILRYDYSIDLGGRLTARIVKDPNGMRRLQVSNATPRRLQLIFIPDLQSSPEYSLGALGAGESKEFLLGARKMVMDYFPPPSFKTNMINEAEPYPSSISSNLLEEVHSRLARGADPRSSISLPPMARLLALTDEPVFPSGVLGPIRHSFNILEVEVEGEDGE